MNAIEQQLMRLINDNNWTELENELQNTTYTIKNFLKVYHASMGFLNYRHKNGLLENPKWIKTLKLLIEYGCDAHEDGQLLSFVIPIPSENEEQLNQKKEILTWLIENGADVNDKKCPPLATAVAMGDLSLIDFLIQKGANTHDKHVLYAAVAYDQAASFQALLSRGADIEANFVNYAYPLWPQDNGDNFLIGAIKKRAFTVIPIILPLSNLAVVNHNNRNFWHCLTAYNRRDRIGLDDSDTTADDRKITKEIASHFDTHPEAKWLAQQLINNQDHHGFTPLQYAISDAREAVIEFLLENGAPIEDARKFINQSFRLSDKIKSKLHRVLDRLLPTLLTKGISIDNIASDLTAIDRSQKSVFHRLSSDEPKALQALVRGLFTSGIDINDIMQALTTLDRSQSNAFHCLADKDPTVLQQLVAFFVDTGIPINDIAKALIPPDRNRSNVFHCLVSKHPTALQALVTFLVKKGTNINDITNALITPGISQLSAFHYLADKDPTVFQELVGFLVDTGAQIKDITNGFTTFDGMQANVFHYLADKAPPALPKLINFLIDKGAEINDITNALMITTKTSCTIFHELGAKDPEVLTWLVSFLVNTGFEKKAIATALVKADNAKHHFFHELSKRAPEILHVLLTALLDKWIDQFSNTETPFLDFAKDFQHIEVHDILKTLITADDNHSNAFHQLASKAPKTLLMLVMFLFNKGAEAHDIANALTAVDNDQSNAFHQLTATAPAILQQLVTIFLFMGIQIKTLMDGVSHPDPANTFDRFCVNSQKALKFRLKKWLSNDGRDIPTNAVKDFIADLTWLIQNKAGFDDVVALLQQKNTNHVNLGDIIAHHQPEAAIDYIKLLGLLGPHNPAITFDLLTSQSFEGLLKTQADLHDYAKIYLSAFIAQLSTPGCQLADYAQYRAKVTKLLLALSADEPETLSLLKTFANKDTLAGKFSYTSTGWSITATLKQGTRMVLDIKARIADIQKPPAKITEYQAPPAVGASSIRSTSAGHVDSNAFEMKPISKPCHSATKSLN